VRLITGHDTRGYANHDWLALAADGEVAAIYMGKKSARFIQGRLLMHGANPDTPVTIIENVSRPDQRIIACTLGTLEPTMSDANLTGPALTFLGLAPRDAAANIPATFTQQEAL
jgi:uroporphyrin-III C-methyltransferase/precorrin-2 dehydrogenase/sirohydrochlorin ferrochelatase